MNEAITSPLDGILAQVAGLGAHFDASVAAATRSIYAPSLDLSPAAFEQLDVPYGDPARHRADPTAPPNSFSIGTFDARAPGARYPVIPHRAARALRASSRLQQELDLDGLVWELNLAGLRAAQNAGREQCR